MMPEEPLHKSTPSKGHSLTVFRTLKALSSRAEIKAPGWSSTNEESVAEDQLYYVRRAVHARIGSEVNGV
jgi:hypothetical protein